MVWTDWGMIIAVTIVYAALVEYATHRWTMHFPGLGKASWWRDHAVEHHGKGRNDINIDLSALTTLLAGLPLLVFCTKLGWPWVAFVMLACILYAAIWTSLHGAYHELSESWMSKLPIYTFWRSHHMRHHDDPARNVGTVFVFTDLLFGTYVPPAAALQSRAR